MNPERAIDYIREHGDRLAQARLDYALNNQAASREVIAALISGQRADGGWPPYWAADYSSLDATCFRLAQAEQIGLSVSDSAIARAARFLARRQHADGSWEEDRAHALAAPSWVKPGRRAARLYITANCGFWLAITARSQPGVALTARFLQARLSERGEMPTYLQAHWLAAGMWRSLGWSAPTELALGYLAQRVEELPAASLAWMGLTLAISGLPAYHDLMLIILDTLGENQREDGTWSGDNDERGADVHTTLEVLRILRMSERL